MGLGEVIGTTVFPAIGGRLADLYGLTSTIYLVIAASAISFVLCLFAKETAPQVVAAKQSKELAA
jgi:MFS family permease